MSITVTTYVNSSDEHVLTPSIVKVDENKTVVFKSDVNILKPTIVLSNDMSRHFNYIYISEFDRYYFAKVTRSQNMYIAECSVDPLYSWETYIGDLELIANRSSSTYNTYQKDDSIPFENRNIISTQPFSSGFVGDTLVLAVNGGGNPSP